MTTIQLYRCYRCGRIHDNFDLDEELGCRKCGGYHFSMADGNFWNTVRYFFTHIGRVTKLVVRENVFRLG